MSIIDAFLPSFATDSVAVYDQALNQIFRRARSIRARIREEARVMEHPIETGAVITDHRVIMPVEIELSMILASRDYQSVYKEIRGYYLNSTLLIVKTRAGIYQNQLIAAMPHEEDPGLYDALTLGLSFKQALLVEPEFNIVTNDASNNVVVDKGTLQGSPPTVMQMNAVTSIVQSGSGL